MDSLEAVVRWVDWLQAQERSERTIDLYFYGVFRLIRACHVTDLTHVTEEDIVAFLNGIGDHSVAKRKYLLGVRSLFTYCLARGLVGRDPTAGIKLRKAWRKPQVALTEDELFRYFMAAYQRSPRRAWTLVLVFSIGARRMEVAAIKPDDIQGSEVHLKECKYGKERRVALNRYALIALEELRPWYNGTVLGGIRRQTVTEWAHRAALDSGLYPKVQGRVAHVLRASFISHLLDREVPLPVVRDLVGHESIATTNTYAVALPRSVAGAVDRVDFGRWMGAESHP